MARSSSVNIATVYSSAQCVLSVVGSVGVILLFAGIPQLIYSPVVNVANLMTFLLGAILITTMVAGNSFLNYKYRRFEREARQRRRTGSSTENGSSEVDPEDKPPSYEAILTSDGLPPDYYTILVEKPPRYEDIANGVFSQGMLPCDTEPHASNSTTITSETSASIEVTPGICELDIVPEVIHPKAVSLDNGVNSATRLADSDDTEGAIHQDTLDKSLKADERSRERDEKKTVEEERVISMEVSIHCDNGALSKLGLQESFRNLNESEL